MLKIACQIFSLLDMFFTSWIIEYPSHFHLVKANRIKYNLENILYNILSNEWELKIVYQQNFPVRKKSVSLFLGKVFPSSFTVNIW